MGRQPKKPEPCKIEINSETVAVWEGDQLQWVESSPVVAQSLFGHRCSPNRLLPMAVRWVGPGGRVWVWERPPQPQSVVYDGLSYAVCLPWTVMVVDTINGEVSVFARPGPLHSMDDELFALPLPGINQSGRLPIVRMQVGYPAETILARALELFQAQRWLGKVPDDWRPAELRVGGEIDMLTTWQKAGPLDVVDWGWVPRTTLNQLVSTEDESPSTVRALMEKAVRRA
jgi:hypothetical protein